MQHKHFGFFLLGPILLAAIAIIAWPRPASAQCGSSASSCKNCHEVQKVMPINAKGVWHSSHAFGDFCEFCHAGNAKSKDKAAAHTGMVAPLADVKGACQSCHPNDYNDRAKKYADALGKPIGTTAVSISTSPSSGTTTTAANNPGCGPTAPTGGQTIDLNKVYAGLGETSSTNTGNLILGGLIAMMVLLLLGLVFYYEHPVQRGVAAFRQLLATPVSTLAPENLQAASPELGTLLQLLSTSDPATLRALRVLLADRENGPKLVQALSHMDLNALGDLGERDQKALTALLTLAREMG